MKPSSESKILLIGNDQSLAYLIERYAGRCSLGMATAQEIPSAKAVRTLNPSVLLFCSMEHLEAAQALIADLANADISVLVCSSVSDQARASELGADHCLLHPVSYDGFLAVLTAIGAPKPAET